MTTVQYVPVTAKALERLQNIATERDCTLAEAVEEVSIFSRKYLTEYLARLLHHELLRRGVDH